METRIDVWIQDTFRQRLIHQSQIQAFVKNHENGNFQTHLHTAAQNVPSHSVVDVASPHASSLNRSTEDGWRDIKSMISISGTPLVLAQSICIPFNSGSPVEIDPLVPVNPTHLTQSHSGKTDSTNNQTWTSTKLVHDDNELEEISIANEVDTPVRHPALEAVQHAFQEQIRKLYPQIIVPVTHPLYGHVTVFLQFQLNGWTRARFETDSAELQTLLVDHRHLFEAILNASPLQSRPHDLAFIHCPVEGMPNG